MSMYEDCYVATFGCNHYAEMKAEQKKLEAESSWENDVKSMFVTHLEDPMDAIAKSTAPSNSIPREILMDTVENTSLILNYNGKEACLRDCAMTSLLTTAGESGNGFNRVSSKNQAVCLTALLTGCRERSSILTRAGKVSAVLSSRYEYMPISELLDICDGLERSFGRAEFIGGEVNHSMTVAQYRYPQAAKTATAAYNAALAAVGRSSGEVIPVVEFRSSDTSGESATLLTYLQIRPGHLFPIGEGVKVAHIPPLEFDGNGNRMTCMNKFRQESEVLFSKLEYDITVIIPKMLDVKIDYPANTFIGLCKYALIPQKWGGLIEEEIRADWPDGSDCTFLDIYEALTQATAYAIKDGLKPHSARILNLEEGISKVARNQNCWKKYDLPGTVAWSNTAANR